MATRTMYTSCGQASSSSIAAVPASSASASTAPGRNIGSSRWRQTVRRRSLRRHRHERARCSTISRSLRCRSRAPRSSLSRSSRHQRWKHAVRSLLGWHETLARASPMSPLTGQRGQQQRDASRATARHHTVFSVLSCSLPPLHTRLIHIVTVVCVLPPRRACECVRDRVCGKEATERVFSACIMASSTSSSNDAEGHGIRRILLSSNHFDMLKLPRPSADLMNQPVWEVMPCCTPRIP